MRSYLKGIFFQLMNLLLTLYQQNRKFSQILMYTFIMYGAELSTSAPKTTPFTHLSTSKSLLSRPQKVQPELPSRWSRKRPVLFTPSVSRTKPGCSPTRFSTRRPRTSTRTQAASPPQTHSAA